MKKILALLLTVVMLLSMAVCVSAQQQFTDLSETHWAYANIQQLVAEGTIKGYPDGSFRPESLVTRAEFAKMFGEGTNKKTSDFKDLTAAHWSYSYVMASGVDADKEYFRPDDYMTRGEVLDALWDRCGEKVNAKVPGVIARQFSDEDAVTWAYTTQLIKGNDGIDLRLSDTITRAEVTALILRVRVLDTTNLKSITDNISDKLISKVVETLDIFDREYVADSKLTNGEVAHAAMTLAYGTDKYAPLVHYGVKFEGKYKVAVAAMTSYIWDDVKNTKEFAEKNATNLDSLLALMNAVVISSQSEIPVGSDRATYSDVDMIKGFPGIYVTYAYNKGIFNTTDGSLGAQKEITMKEFVAMLLQADNVSGFSKNYKDGKYVNANILRESDKYPISYKNYGVIISGVPAYIYDNAGFADAVKDDYFTVNAYDSVIKTYLNSLAKKENDKKLYKFSYTYYPSLTSITNSDVQFVLKLEFDDVAQGTTFASVFNGGTTELIEEGKTYYVLVSAGTSFSDYIPVDNTKIVKIIASY